MADSRGKGSTKSQREPVELFSARDPAGPFVFDEAVARVLPDMLRRSIPGYDALLQLITVLAQQTVSEGTRVYDLGCSRGAVSLALARALWPRPPRIIAVDNSPAMIRQLKADIEAVEGSPIEPVCQDALDVEIAEASLVVLNFTLQFVPLEKRDQLIGTISAGLLPGAALVLSEKTEPETAEQATRQMELHDAFRRANGYSQLELARKRQALENVLVVESEARHEARLRAAGLTPLPWFRCLQFVSWIAVKD